MSLPACQQRILDGIAGTMQARDPRLAAMFSIFTRLTRQEPMPWAEEPEDDGRLRRALQELGRSRALRAGLRAYVIIPLVFAASVSFLILSPAVGSPRACGRLAAARSLAAPAAHVSGCAAVPTSGAIGYPLH
jgi:hypothetical protein